MSSNSTQGPDFKLGVPAGDIGEGEILLGHVGERAVILLRSQNRLYALGAECSHYHGPLSEGLIVGNTIRCPWHHARFDLNTGDAVGAPAIDPVPCWKVEEKDGKVFVSAGRPITAKTELSGRKAKRVVIIGGGAAGFATAEMLRRRGFEGKITLISADADAPYDRPNCSKDYLAGKAPKAWMPLRDEAFYRQAGIDLRLRQEVARFDPGTRTVFMKDGASLEYDVLVLAMGAEPKRPPISGLDGKNVFVLRSQKDADAIIAATAKARSVAVIGASFIGLEVAAALRQRDLAVHVIAPERILFEKIMGPEIGEWVKRLHERQGVTFHLGSKVLNYDGKKLALDPGDGVPADFVVLGTGVQPRTALAEAAGLKVENGVITDANLKTSADGVYAAGDIARYPDPVSGHLIRVEHWVHAQRQGQYLARLILGEDEPYSDPPFFWSSHYDKTISYSGHADAFESRRIDGSIEKEDVAVSYLSSDKVLAVATIGRDLENLKAEKGFQAGKTHR